MNASSNTRNIKIPVPIHTKLKIHAAISNKKLQEVVEEALTSYLDHQKKESDEIIEIQR